MKKHEESRRAFLIGTAVGAGAVAGAGLVPDALAQTHEQHNAADAPATTAQGARACRRARRVPQRRRCRHGHGIRRADHAGRTGQAGRARRRRAQLHRSRAGRRLFRSAGLLPPRARCARCALPHDLQQAVRATHRRATGRSHHARSKAARRPASPGRARRRSSTRCARTRWKACSPTPSMAATRTSPAGCLVGFPGAQPLFSPADLQSRDAFAGAPIVGLQAQSKTAIRRT